MASPMSTNLLSEIEEFRAETGMGVKAFCRVFGNGRLIDRLREAERLGKRPRIWPETEIQVRAFIMAERQKRVAA